MTSRTIPPDRRGIGGGLDSGFPIGVGNEGQGGLAKGERRFLLRFCRINAEIHIFPIFSRDKFQLFTSFADLTFSRNWRYVLI